MGNVGWEHLRTTNPLESPFAALRLRTDAAKRYKRVDRATAVIWKMLMIANDQRLGPGRGDVDGGHNGHRRRRRVD